jgi:hypothetical protein
MCIGAHRTAGPTRLRGAVRAQVNRVAVVGTLLIVLPVVIVAGRVRRFGRRAGAAGCVRAGRTVRGQVRGPRPSGTGWVGGRGEPFEPDGHPGAPPGGS